MGMLKGGTCEKEHPDNFDAELLLRLYDLRREAKLRQGREWFIREFQAKSFDDYLAQAPPGSENSALFRMTVTYWDMAASLVNHGLINEDLFFENTPEFWIIWDKVRNVAPNAAGEEQEPHGLEKPGNAGGKVRGVDGEAGSGGVGIPAAAAGGFRAEESSIRPTPLAAGVTPRSMLFLPHLKRTLNYHPSAAGGGWPKAIDTSVSLGDIRS